MKYRNTWVTAAAAAGIAFLTLGSSAAFAQHGGGGGHAGGFGGGGHAGGYGGHPGGYGGRGGYGYGGYRGGYGGYRGGYGWRGGYYGGWGPWGWGGLGLGLYFSALPLYYSTLWWEGVPYYYADNTYYRYDSGVGQYQTVAPPDGVQTAAANEQVGTDLMAYPKNGQTTDQQAKDKYECHHWATTQSGFDPTQGAPATASSTKRSDYMRADAACLEGRGYSVK